MKTGAKAKATDTGKPPRTIHTLECPIDDWLLMLTMIINDPEQEGEPTK
jgi:hypothetical protein